MCMCVFIRFHERYEQMLTFLVFSIYIITFEHERFCEPHQPAVCVCARARARVHVCTRVLSTHSARFLQYVGVQEGGVAPPSSVEGH